MTGQLRVVVVLIGIWCSIALSACQGGSEGERTPPQDPSATTEDPSSTGSSSPSESMRPIRLPNLIRNGNVFARSISNYGSVLSVVGNVVYESFPGSNPRVFWRGPGWMSITDIIHSTGGDMFVWCDESNLIFSEAPSDSYEFFEYTDSNPVALIVPSCLVSSSGTLLGMAGTDAAIYSTRSKRLLNSIELANSGLAGLADRHVILGNGSQAKVVDLRSGRVMFRLQSNCGYTSDGDTVVLCMRDGLEYFDIEEGVVRERLTAAGLPPGSIVDLDLNAPSGLTAVGTDAGRVAVFETGGAKVRDVDFGQPIFSVDVAGEGSILVVVRDFTAWLVPGPYAED